jgi:5-methyltetrahydropteroyltriglutamate--homocysteine methyltransferase
VGQEELAADIENLKLALQNASAEEAFMTAISPSNLELYYENRYYGSDEQYLAALADAMHVEYKAIVDAGFLLQIDDPRMATHYNRAINSSIDDCRKFIGLRVEAVNHALRDIPEDRVRFHTCYSVNIAPRVYDFELKHFVDLMLKVRAGAYLIEAANPRHEHEWQLWQDVKLPDDKILIPGVVSHCIHLVEHPELVAQRIVRFAEVVGRERVIAGTDCGFGTSGAGDEVHPEVAWAKLQSMVDGARLASRRLWAR